MGSNGVKTARDAGSNKPEWRHESTACDPVAVRAQLEKLLASSHLKNSRRSQDLLRFVVRAVLDGNPDRIKERTVGVEVFGRELEYDTNHDSVVRNAAIEVRKRLAQYYLDPSHQGELRITLPQGGYVPEFTMPPRPAELEPAAEKKAGPDWARRALPIAGVGIIVAASAGLWLLAQSPQRDLDRFWAPLLQDPGGVLICVGQPSRLYAITGPRQDTLRARMDGAADAADAQDPATISSRELAPVWKNFIYFGDSVCMTKVGGLVLSARRPVSVRGASATVYQDLRGKPLVLIGLNNNKWTQRFTSSLRYYFVRAPEQHRDEVRDREHPERAPWVVPGEPRSDEIFDDYALVSRVLDPSTEKTLVAIAGVTQYGTQSAGDFITNPDYVRQAFRGLRSDWSRKNIQIVLKTRIVTGAAGPPEVVAAHVW
jgi:hypothetical protein